MFAIAYCKYIYAMSCQLVAADVFVEIYAFDLNQLDHVVVIKTNKIWCNCFDVGQNNCDLYSLEGSRWQCQANPLDCVGKKLKKDIITVGFREHFSARATTLNHLTSRMAHINLVHFWPKIYTSQLLSQINAQHIDKFVGAFLHTTNRHTGNNPRIGKSHIICNADRYCMFLPVQHIRDDFDVLAIYPKDPVNGKICDTCMLHARYLARTRDIVVIESRKQRNTLAKICMTAIRMCYFDIGHVAMADYGKLTE